MEDRENNIVYSLDSITNTIATNIVDDTCGFQPGTLYVFDESSKVPDKIFETTMINITPKIKQLTGENNGRKIHKKS